MKVAMIGTGNVGRSVGELLGRGGHEIHYGSRHPGDPPEPGERISVASIAEAAQRADVVVCATPYGAWPELARQIAPYVAGKVVIDAANPYPQRDGEFAQRAIDAGNGAGQPVAQLLPGAKVARAFNAIRWPDTMAASRPGQPEKAIAFATDDPDARQVTAQLIRDAGFDPVDAGGLVEARRFDPNTPAYGQTQDRTGLERALARAR